MNIDYSILLREVGAKSRVRACDDLIRRIGYTADVLSSRPLAAWIHPDDRSAIDEVVSAGCGSAEGRHATKSGDWILFNWRIETVGDAVHALGEPQNAGFAPEDFKAQASGNHQTMNEMLAAFALIVESKNPGKRCSILLVDPETRRINVGAGPSFPSEYNEAVEGLQIGPQVGSCGTAAFWNVPVVVSDIARDPLWRELRDAARMANVSACWSQPIRSMNGKVLGAMALYDTSPSTPERYQMDGLAIAARMVGLAIERAELEAQVRQVAKMEALGVLAGGVAHDFNNLLGVILGNADLAIASLSSNDKARDMLDDIATASKSAAELCKPAARVCGSQHAHDRDPRLQCRYS